MAWTQIAADKLTVPLFQLCTRYDRRGSTSTGISKRPTGSTIEVTFYTWRCSGCRMLATTKEDAKPGTCIVCRPKA